MPNGETIEIDEGVPTPVERVTRRLSYQHSRWRVDQGFSPTQLRNRSIMRMARRSLNRVSKAVGLVLNSPIASKSIVVVGYAGLAVYAVGLLGAFLYLPWLLLNLAPSEIVYPNDAIKVQVGLWRTAWVTNCASIFCVLVFHWTPPTDELKQALKEQKRKRDRVAIQAGNRAMRVRTQSLRFIFWGLAAVNVLLAIFLWQASGSFASWLLAVFVLEIGVAAFAILLHEVCIRVSWTTFCPRWLEALIMVFACLMVLSLLAFIGMFAAGESLQWSNSLAWCGPFGFVFANVYQILIEDRVTASSLIRSATMIGLSAVCIWFATRISRKLRVWSTRRAIVLQRRLQTAIKPVANPIPLKRSELVKRIRDDLDANGAKRFWKRSLWINPSWLKRSYIGYLLALGGVTFLITPLLLILPTLREGELAPVIGDTHYRLFDIESLLESMQIILFAFLVFFVELSATFDANRSLARSIDQRPVHSFRHWWRMQVDGVQRFPLQLVLASPVIALGFVFDAANSIDVAVQKTIQILVALAMFRTIFATTAIAQTLQSCFRGYLWVWLTATHLILSAILILSVLMWLCVPNDSWTLTFLLSTCIVIQFALIALLRERLRGYRSVRSTLQ